MTAAQDLFTAFATARSLPNFAPDADGFASLKLESGVAVDMRVDGDRVCVYSSLGAVPAAHEELVLTALLASNQAGGIGEGPIFALDPNLGDIMLSMEVDARTTDHTALLRVVLAVGEHLEIWRRRLQSLDTPTAAEDDELSPAAAILPHLMIRG